MSPIILLLDDRRENLDVMQRMLKRLPGMTVKVVSFTAGEEALAWCREHEPDICVVDYNMPTMDGIEFISTVRQQSKYKGIPIIMVTGSADSELRQRALASGANDFMTRPVNTDEFLAKVYNLLTLRMSLVDTIERLERLALDVELLAQQTLERDHEQIIFKLHQLSATRDEETGNHMHRVAHVSRLIAQELCFDEQFCDMIYLAAPMHDIGKVGIPDKILLKSGKLTADEWEILKTHTTIGYEVLKDSGSPLLRMGAEIAHTHHEKFNGLGYPLGLAGEKIPVAGRIVAVADELDALLSIRPYKLAWNITDALVYMRKICGVHFDPGCVDAMLKQTEVIVEIYKKFADDVETVALAAPLVQRGAA